MKPAADPAPATTSLPAQPGNGAANPMGATVQATCVPPGSRAASLLPGAYFHDAWAIRAARPELDPLAQFLRVAANTPAWIEAAMAARNRIVGLVGLKNLGGLSQLQTGRPAASYQVGDRVGIFTLLERHADEVLLGDHDKHLHVVVAVHRAVDSGAVASAEGASSQPPGAIITVSTIVHVHNTLGRLYMLPVTPAHRVIARRMVAGIGRG